jgi:phosphoenolpyruvate carboxykinase (ATP)
VVFGIAMQECPNVPSEILNPRNTWKTKIYTIKSNRIRQKFKANFAKFEEFANPEIMAGAPNA